MPKTRRIASNTMPAEAPSTRRGRRGAEGADWRTADGEVLRELVAVVSAQGGAVRFGYTSDGGAYAVGFYGDGDPYTEYIRPGEGLNEVLTEFIANWR